jgi:3-hydroxyisobutyrate dehydrogenase
MATIAALGTGVMGAPMARNLARAGHEVRAWNRSPDKAAPLRDDGIDVRDDPSAAAAGADVVLTMLADADAVLDVARRTSLAEGQIWWQASTIGIEGIEQCAALAQETGAILVDAPVLGTRLPAEEGNLVVLASGPDAALDTLAPLFDAVGQRTMRLGPAGTATRLKLAVNLWVLAVTQGTAETIAFAQSLGVEPEWVLEALEGGALDLPYFRMKSKLMLEEDFPASFALALAAKDARLVAEAAEGHGADLPIAAAIAQRFTQATEAGHGDEDMAATYRLSKPS